MMILSTSSLYRGYGRGDFACRDDALDACMIVISVYCSARRGVMEKRGHRLAHAGADLNGESAIGRQVTNPLRRNAPIIIEAGPAAVQRAARLPSAHFRHERVDIRAANVRRI